MKYANEKAFAEIFGNMLLGMSKYRELAEDTRGDNVKGHFLEIQKSIERALDSVNLPKLCKNCGHDEFELVKVVVLKETDVTNWKGVGEMACLRHGIGYNCSNCGTRL